MPANKWFHLFFSNFLGVFNDNFLKNSIIFVAITWNLPDWMSSSQLISIVSACLVVPYVLLSPIGGLLATKYSKVLVFRWLKLIEIPIVAIAIVSFYFQWIYVAIFSMLLIGTQSSLYSPSKYGLIKDIGGEQEASFGSGAFEAMAFIGILTGTFSASMVSDHYSLSVLAAVLLLVAVLGYIITNRIKVQELPVDTDQSQILHPIKFLTSSYRFAKQFKLVNSAVLGAASFWLIGSLLQMNIILYSKTVLHITNTLTGVIMASAAVGIALGTAFSGKFLKGRDTKGFIIPALIGMIICLIGMVSVTHTFTSFLITIVTFAFLGGMFQVPSLTMIQQTDLGRNIGNVIAYLNTVTFIFILLSTVIFSSITYLTNESSLAVFFSMIFLCVIILLYFLLRHADFLQSSKSMIKSSITKNKI